MNIGNYIYNPYSYEEVNRLLAWIHTLDPIDTSNIGKIDRRI